MILSVVLSTCGSKKEGLICGGRELQNSVGKSEGERPLVRPKQRWKVILKMVLREIVEWIQMF
jgi:hypothetical protein